MDNKHDKLDDFLRNQLNDSTENPSWNVPGDHVFDNAMNALPQKKNNRRFWLILPLLLLVVLVGREFMHMNQIKSLENKVAALEESNTLPSSHQKITSQSESITTENKNIQADANTPSAHPEYDNNISNTGGEENTILPSEATTNHIANTNETDQSKLHQDESGSAYSAYQAQVNPSIDQQNTIATNTTQGTPSLSLSDNPSVNSFEPSSPLTEDPIRMTMDEETILSTTSAVAVLPLSPFSINERGTEIKKSVPSVIVSTPSVTPLPLQFGILIGGNSSWLTMQNIPQGTKAELYDYDNHQPGGNAYAFIEKPLSKRWSVQAGIGYQYYQNQSVLEDKFLFDEANITMQDGKEFYMAPIDVINPLGDMKSMLDFRVSDEMHQNDILNEYTTMKQKLHAVHLDVSVAYTFLSFGRFDLAAGAGLGLSYLATIENDFNVSCFHNGELQSSRKETPKELSDSQKWYGQAIGKLNIAYHLTHRMDLVLETQYRSGISSLRRGTEVNGSQTYLHSFGLSAGLKHNF